MKYRLLSTGYGVLTDRTPIGSASEAVFTFEGAPDGASAFFTSAKGTFYRTLNGGACSVYAGNLIGRCEVGVILPDTAQRPCRWICEGLVGKIYPGGVWIAPDDGDIPARMSRIEAEADDIRRQARTLAERMDKLAEEFEKLYEGYDIV